MFLGMFTWDATEDFATRENYNHEVDIELTRRGDPNNPNDAQFLVQPPREPSFFRFSTKETLTDDTFDQAPHAYSFTWNPGDLFWESTHGMTHSYTTAQSVQWGFEDYVQCLPANVELRINLWNMDGTLAAPLEMNDNEMIEVVIDDVSYTPSGETGIPDGGTCTKDCQCEAMSVCNLSNNQCESVVDGMTR